MPDRKEGILVQVFGGARDKIPKLQVYTEAVCGLVRVQITKCLQVGHSYCGGAFPGTRRRSALFRRPGGAPEDFSAERKVI